MAVHGYTKNLRLTKTEYNTDTWHDAEWDNLDVIDAAFSVIYKFGNFKGIWKNSTSYSVDDVVIDPDGNDTYTVTTNHTTDSSSTFSQFYAANPSYYNSWNGLALSKQWAIKTDDKVDDGADNDYSSKAYAISSNLIDDGSSKEWANKTDGTIGTTGEYSAKKHATDASSSASTAISQASAASASATLAQQWAVDASLVASTDYSAKSWATGSLNAGSAKDWAIKEGGQVGTTGKYSAKVYSLAAENHYEKARDWASKTNGQVESTDYSAKAYAASSGIVPTGSAKEWATSSSIVADGKYGASYYALQAYNANVSAQSNKTLSQEWATKMDGQVASTDYSSKYYASASATSASDASTSESHASIWAEGTDEQVQALGGTHSAKGWAESTGWVTLGTTQTITGDKTHEGELNIDNNFTGSGYSSAIKFSSNGTAKGYVYYSSTEDDFAITDSGYNLATLRVKTQAATDDSNKAATTKWVNTTGNNVVHLSDSETITGVKTFANSICGFYGKNTNLASNGTTPATTLQTLNCVGLANDGSWTGALYAQAQADGINVTTIAARRLVSGSNVTANLGIYVDASGNKHAYAPTPSSAESNSTDIATTAWVNSSNKTGRGIGSPYYGGATSFNLTSSTPYTATENGWIQGETTFDQALYSVMIDGNSIGVGATAVGYYAFKQAFVAPIAKGSVVTTSATTTLALKFIPCK